MTTIPNILLTSWLCFTASADIDQQLDQCVKSARSDVESAECLDRFSAEMDRSLVDTAHRLLERLRASEGRRSQATLLEDAHAKFLVSRDADCKLRAAVTMDDPADRADAEKQCAYEANVPRLRQYERFLGFLR